MEIELARFSTPKNTVILFFSENLRHSFQQQKIWGWLALHCHKHCFPALKFASLRFRRRFSPVSAKKTNKSEMTRKNSQSCQYALKKFKSAELSLKSKLDLLQSANDQRKSVRSLTLLINKAKSKRRRIKNNTWCRVKGKSKLKQHFICHGTMFKPSVTSREIWTQNWQFIWRWTTQPIFNYDTRWYQCNNSYECQVSKLTEMLTIYERDSSSKQPRTFIILQQNTTSSTETGETIPLFVWMPQSRTKVVKVFKWQQRETPYYWNEYSKFIQTN